MWYFDLQVSLVLPFWKAALMVGCPDSFELAGSIILLHSPYRFCSFWTSVNFSRWWTRGGGARVGCWCYHPLGPHALHTNDRRLRHFLALPAVHTPSYAVCTTCQEVTCTNEDKMTSALSVGAQVHATRRPYGARGVLLDARICDPVSAILWVPWKLNVMNIVKSLMGTF